MKRKMKAVAALSLAAVMLLAGCGSSKGTQDGGSAAAADTAADTAEQQAGTETAASDSGEKIVIPVLSDLWKMKMIQQILLPSRQSEVTM